MLAYVLPSISDVHYFMYCEKGTKVTYADMKHIDTRARIAQSVEHQTFKRNVSIRHLRVWGSSPHAGYVHFLKSH